MAAQSRINHGRVHRGQAANDDQRANDLLFELTGIQYSPVYTSPSGAPMVTFAFPFGDPVKGYAAAEMSLSELAEQLSAQRVGSAGYVYLVDRKGRFIAGRPGAGTPIVGESLTSLPVVKSLVESTQSFESDSLRVGNFGQGKDAVVAAYGFRVYARRYKVVDNYLETPPVPPVAQVPKATAREKLEK
jgi:hypothetical protein